MIDGRPLVDIHMPGSKDPVPDGGYTAPWFTAYDRAELAWALVEQGADVAFTRGAAAFDFESGEATILRPTFDMDDGVRSVYVEPERVAIAGVHSVRNLVLPLHHGVPELNHPGLRKAAYDKGTTNGILQGIGMAKDYALIGPEHPVESALEAVPADTSDLVVVKRRRGQNGEGLLCATKSEIADTFASGGLDVSKGWVVEELLGFDAPLDVKGADEASQARIDQANGDRRARELRTYVFGRDPDGNPITGYVMRAALDGDRFVGRNDWIYVRPDSIPDDIVAGTDTVLRAFEDHVGIREAHMVIDWVRATGAHGDVRTIPMEVNGSRPQLVYRAENRQLSMELQAKLARQLIRVAENGGTQ